MTFDGVITALGERQPLALSQGCDIDFTSETELEVAQIVGAVDRVIAATRDRSVEATAPDYVRPSVLDLVFPSIESPTIEASGTPQAAS